MAVKHKEVEEDPVVTCFFGFVELLLVSAGRNGRSKGCWVFLASEETRTRAFKRTVACRIKFHL